MSSCSVSRYVRSQSLLRFMGLLIIGLCALGALPGAATAQQPTQAQRDAIKASCRSDFISHCSGVSPGGQAALSCLQQNSASLSSACQKALGGLKGAAAKGASAPAAATTPAAPTMGSGAAALTPRQEVGILRQACGPDFQSYCRDVPLGRGRGIACLKRNMPRLSPSCQQVLSRAQ